MLKDGTGSRPVLINSSTIMHLLPYFITSFCVTRSYVSWTLDLDKTCLLMFQKFSYIPAELFEHFLPGFMNQQQSQHILVSVHLK